MQSASSHEVDVNWLEEQALLRLAGIERRLEEVRRACVDREDAAGTDILIRVLSLILAQGRRFVEEQAFELRRTYSANRVQVIRNVLAEIRITAGDVLFALVLEPGRDMASLVKPYVRLARAVSDDDQAELILTPSEDLNYEVYPSYLSQIEGPVEELAEELAKTVRDIPRIAVVAYPAQADSETFLHAVVAHEVAHLRMSDGSLGEQLLDEAFERAVESTEFASLPADDSRVQRLRDWLLELLCDSLAVELIGPCFALALIELLVPGQGMNIKQEPGIGPPQDDAVEAHPPAAWRIRRLRDSVDGFFADPQCDRAATERLAAAADAVAQQYELVDEDRFGDVEHEQQERQLLDAAFGHLQEQGFGDFIGRGRYTRGRFQRDLPLVWDKLSQGIAPADRVKGRKPDGDAAVAEDDVPRAEDDQEPEPESDWSQPLDWRSILNGVYLDHLSQRQQPEPDPSALTVLRRRNRRSANSMARGAIELSELHRQMLSMRRQFDWLGEA